MDRTGFALALFGIALASLPSCTTEFATPGDSAVDTAADPDAVTDGTDGVDVVDVGDTGDPVADEAGCTGDGDCDNGVFCDGEEACESGECVMGMTPGCEDGDPCTLDFCDEVEDGCAAGPLDADGDGYAAFSSPEGDVCGGDDCDDGNFETHPMAEEWCDLADQDCDGTIFDAEGIDEDGDGVPAAFCGGMDCDPGLSAVHGGFEPPPGSSDPEILPAREECNGVDDDCSGMPDDGTGMDCALGTEVACLTACGLWGTGTCSGCEIPEGAACIEPAEICNWMTDDCDAIVDEGAIADRSATDYQVDAKTGEAWFVRACWNGTVYGVVWDEQIVVDATSIRNEVWFAIMDRDGLRVGDSTLVDSTVTTSNIVPPNAAIACGTDRFGVLVNRRTAAASSIVLHLRMYTGTAFMTPVTVSQATALVSSSDITFDSSDLAWGIAWTNTAGNAVLFQPMTQTGSPWGGTLVNRTISGALSSGPDQVRIVSENAGRFAATWVDARGTTTRGVMYQRIATSAAAGPDLLVWSATGHVPSYPEIAWSGTAARHRLVWIADGSTGGTTPSILMTAEVSGVVTPSVTDPAEAIASGTTTAIARASIDRWEGYMAYLVAWYDMTTGAMNVNAFRLDDAGTPLEAPITIDDGGSPFHPEVVAGPGTPWAAVVWDDGRGGAGFDPHMDFLGCF